MVRSAEQLLTFERLYKVEPGVTTESQVRELLGRPAQVMNLAMGPAWEWRVDLSPNMGFFVVNFDRQGRGQQHRRIDGSHARLRRQGGPVTRSALRADTILFEY